jgi:hypothetical protein
MRMANGEWRMAGGEWQVGREKMVYFDLISRVVFTNNTAIRHTPCFIPTPRHTFSTITETPEITADTAGARE